MFVDTETNGGNGVGGRVIEVAAIKVHAGQITETYQSFVNPGGTIPFWITNLTGITNNDLVQAPYFEDNALKVRLMSGQDFGIV